jgi:hypothetical protein
MEFNELMPIQNDFAATACRGMQQDIAKLVIDMVAGGD